MKSLSLSLMMAFLLLAFSGSPSYALTCSTPGRGCGDANIVSNPADLKHFSTSSNTLKPITQTICCSCSNVTKNFQEIMDGHRQNFILDVLGAIHFTRAMALSAVEIQNVIASNALNNNSVVDAASSQATLNERSKLNAEAAVRGQMSEGLCRMASLEKSLAADDMKRRFTQILLSEIGLARLGGKINSISAAGAMSDQRERLLTFKSEFCRGDDSNKALKVFCGGANGTEIQSSFYQSASNTGKRSNADIDFVKFFVGRESLDIDLADQSSLSKDEQTMIAMSRNLYGHKPIAPRFTEAELKTPAGQQRYQHMRSLLAMRALVQNSFNAMAAEHAAGFAGSVTNIRALYKELGGSDDTVNALVGSRPSYYAGMNALTREIFYTPKFYSQLMEGKTNVARQSAFMDAVGLMQTRDIYQSSLRTEMLLATLINLKTNDRVKDLADALNRK